jgi:hypothetical protein
MKIILDYRKSSGLGMLRFRLAGLHFTQGYRIWMKLDVDDPPPPVGGGVRVGG